MGFTHPTCFAQSFRSDTKSEVAVLFHAAEAHFVQKTLHPRSYITSGEILIAVFSGDHLGWASWCLIAT